LIGIWQVPFCFLLIPSYRLIRRTPSTPKKVYVFKGLEPAAPPCITP
jgi:hypothetical protein